MSISEKLVLLNQDIESAEEKIIEKGGTVTNNGSSHLADNIDTIPTGEETDIVADTSGVTTYSASFRGLGFKIARFPNLTNLVRQSFYNDLTIEEVYMPSVVTLGGDGIFNGCTNIRNIDLSSVSSGIKSLMFDNCSSLTTIRLDFENILAISENKQFQNCSSLVSDFNLLNLVLTTSNTSVFAGCLLLKNFNLPKVTLLGEYVFLNCSSLKSMFLPSLTQFTNRGVFQNCTSMTALIFKEFVTLYSTDVFTSNNTLFYVPSALVETYKSATNWSTLASRIFGYEQETSIALNETFTPNPTATDIVSWDFISVNEAGCTQNSSTGAITIIDVGCFEGTDESSHILVRGLNANNQPVYCGLVHITQEEEL